MECATQTRDWSKYLYFYQKNIKLQPVPPRKPLEALLIPENLTDSDPDGISGRTGSNFIFFITVPTTCSRPSIEMVSFIYIYLCIYFSVFTPLTRP